MVLNSMFKLFLLSITKKYFEVNGRANRKEYIVFVLLHSILIIFLFLPFVIASELTSIPILSIVIDIMGIYILIPCITIVIRRLHDLNVNGKWVIFYSIFPPLLLTLCFFKGTPEPNRYGEPPID